MNVLGKRLLLLLLLPAFLSLPVWSQATGSLNGTVTDPTGAVIPGADITLVNEATAMTRTTTSSADGSYAFPQLQPGAYRLEVIATGFKTSIMEHIPIPVEIASTLNVHLEIGVVTEEVVVEATAAAVNMQDATVGVPFSERQVKALPAVNRNPINFLLLQPGVVNTGESDFDLLFSGSVADLEQRDGSVSGMRSNQTNVTLDGVDVNDFQNQAAFTMALPITLDSIQEFRVTTTGANSSEGVTGGAQVAMVTKSGSNDWHGSAYYFHRNEATSANDFFNNRLGDDPVTGDPIQPVPKLRRHIFGASAGGPIVRNRAFFFVNLESAQQSEESIEDRVIPSFSFRQGVIRYVLDDTIAGFDSTAPGVAPCSSFSTAAAGTWCRELSVADITTLDPANLGPNSAMLAYFDLYPQPNDDSLGVDGGLNWSGIRFNAPIEVDNKIYTARFDFNLTADGSHNAFWRGTLGDLNRDILAAWMPGQDPRAILLNNSRGFVAGYTGQITPTLINAFRWGFTRQGVEQSGQPNDFFGLRTDVVDAPKPSNRAFGRRVPVHNFRNDLTWVRNNHTFQVGANILITRNRRFTFTNSFASYSTNPGFALGLSTEFFDALVGDADPSNDPVDTWAIRNATNGILGAITTVTNTFLVGPDGNALPDGSAQARKFAVNEFEFYGQDSWRLTSNFTLTLGLRWSYTTPVWETQGLQVRPTLDIEQWWNDRVAGMFQGIPSWQSPLLEFELAGKANNAPAWYEPDKNNFSPRIALAWSPGFDGGVGKFLFGGPSRSSLRAGYGLFFNRMGGALAVNNDVWGAVGLATNVSSPTGLFNMATAPRFSGTCDLTGCTGLPPLADFFVTPPAFGFPSAPDETSATGGFMVSNHLKTPYTQNFTFSIQRELPTGVTVDLAYVGTLGRQLLAKADWAQYLNLRDPDSGLTFWEAYNQIVDLIGLDPFRPALDPFTDPIPDIAYFDNIFPNLGTATAAMDGVPLLSNTAAFYYQTTFFAPSWADALFFIDVSMPLNFGFSPYCLDPACTNTGLGNPATGGQAFFQTQYNNLPGWRNWGSSNYHGFQMSVSKSTGNLLFAANYTLSKSIDNGSAAENADLLPTNIAGLFGLIPNAFEPKAHRRLSDYDLRHNFNANWVYELPFGRGQALGSGVPGWVDQIIGGWQLSGTMLWRSGFPLGAGNGANWTTNYWLTTSAETTGPVVSDLDKSAEGGPNLFSDPDTARSNLAYTRPGGVGRDNFITSPGFFQLDSGVAKSFRLPWGESHRLQFRWETYNLFNNVNFDSDNIDIDIETIATFGRMFSSSGTPRVMQFALRYDF